MAILSSLAQLFHIRVVVTPRKLFYTKDTYLPTFQSSFNTFVLVLSSLWHTLKSLPPFAPNIGFCSMLVISTDVICHLYFILRSITSLQRYRFIHYYGFICILHPNFIPCFRLWMKPTASSAVLPRLSCSTCY